MCTIREERVGEFRLCYCQESDKKLFEFLLPVPNQGHRGACPWVYTNASEKKGGSPICLFPDAGTRIKLKWQNFTQQDGHLT